MGAEKGFSSVSVLVLVVALLLGFIALVGTSSMSSHGASGDGSSGVGAGRGLSISGVYTDTWFTSIESDMDIFTGGTSYATVHNATSGDMEDEGATTMIIGQRKIGAGYEIYRGFVFFDTSSVPDDAIITSATLKLTGYVDCSDTNFDIVIQNGQPDYPNYPDLLPTDYNCTYYSGIGGSFNTSGYSYDPDGIGIVLTPTGRGWINKAGITKLCLRSSRDKDYVAPTGNEYVGVYTYEYGMGLQPKLEVTYTINNPPNTPSIVYPSNGATNVPINADLSWTGGDPDGDSVVYDVYFEANNSTPDVLVSDDQSSATYDPGTLSYSTNYYWQIISKDSHGATTDGPVWNFATAAYSDTTPPDTTISAISDYINSLTSITGTATDTSPGKIAGVSVRIKCNDNNNYWNGSSWTSSETWVSASATDGAFDEGSEDWYHNSLPAWANGKSYEIKAKAKDNATNWDLSPASESFTFDTTKPSSSVNSISPYWQTSVPFNITAMASDATSGVENVTLCYRYSTDNSNWTPWYVRGTDYEPPWEWSFPFDLTGYYQFSSFAVDAAGNSEALPLTGDTSCVVIVVEKYFPVFKFSDDEEYYPVSFYFDGDNDIDNNVKNYNDRVGAWNQPYAYINTVQDGNYFSIHYSLYYVFDSGKPILDSIGAILSPLFSWFGDLLGSTVGVFSHAQDFENPMVVVFDKNNLSEPYQVGWGRHGYVGGKPGHPYDTSDDYESWGSAEKWPSSMGTHPVSYVSLGKHGNYAKKPPGVLHKGLDTWRDGGRTLYPEDFNWCLVGGCTGEHVGWVEVLEKFCVDGNTVWISYLSEEPPPPEERNANMYIYDYRYCKMNVLHYEGDTPLIDDCYWPTDFRDDRAPWHRDEVWSLTRPAPEGPYGGAAKIAIGSPVDVHIYDSKNRHVGVNYATRMVENEIPDVTLYFDNEGHQHVKMNLSEDNYRIEVRGTENGTYSFGTAFFDNEAWATEGEGWYDIPASWNEWLDMPITENETQSIPSQPACVLSPRMQRGSAGETLTYDITITNIDNITDNFTLTAEDNLGWNLTLSENLFESVPAGEDRRTTLSVTIPNDATLDNANVIVIKASGARLSAFALCVAAQLKFISISPSKRYGLPGDTLNYTVTVTNKDNVEDTYSLTKSDNAGWFPSLSPISLTIPAGENRTATLIVTISESVQLGAEDVVTVTARSWADPNMSDSASCTAFVVDDTAPLAPSLISPDNGASLNDTTPLLDWNPVSDPSTPVLYQAQVDDDSGFTSVNRDSGWISADQWEVTPALANGTWYWQVRAKDGAGNIGSWSNARLFSIDATAPSRPALVSPADGATLDQFVTFDWSDVSDPSGVTYTLQIDDATDFSTPVREKTGLTLSTYKLTSSEALPNGTYYWHVMAVDGTGNPGKWSSRRSFVVIGTPPDIEIYPSDDAGVDPNYEVRNDDLMSSGWSFLKFDLSSIPTGTNIDSASLHLRVGGLSYGTGASCGIYKVLDDSWSEETSCAWDEYPITWNNQPALGDFIGYYYVYNGGHPLWTNWDVTAWVQSQISGDGEVSLCITYYPHKLIFASKEFCDIPEDSRPYLEIYLA